MFYFKFRHICCVLNFFYLMFCVIVLLPFSLVSSCLLWWILQNVFDKNNWWKCLMKNNEYEESLHTLSAIISFSCTINFNTQSQRVKVHSIHVYIMLCGYKWNIPLNVILKTRGYSFSLILIIVSNGCEIIVAFYWGSIIFW